MRSRQYPIPSHHQRGAVAIIVALSLVVLIGAVGLALDLGKLFIAKTELQNGADACALAASRELTAANLNQLAIAEAAGITTGKRNSVLFQAKPIELDPNLSVKFSADLAGPYKTKDGFITKNEIYGVQYVRCTVGRANIANWFIQVLNVVPGNNITDSTVQATAVAALRPAQTNCAIPVTLCSDDPKHNPPNGTWPPPSGTWLESVVGSKDNLTGSFLWASLNGETGAAKLGAQLTDSGACDLPATGGLVGDPGGMSSLANEWNSRFGVYKGSVKEGDAVPDFTGYAYTGTSWSSEFGAYSDFIGKRTDNAQYQGNVETGLNVDGTIKDADFLKTHGSDRRVAIVPVVACKGFEKSQKVAVQDLACILMLHPINGNAGPSGEPRMTLEYLGTASDPSSPCASSGLPGAEDGGGTKVDTLVQ